MATIGLGDVMPSNLEHNPLITLMFPIGLTLLSVVNSNGYKQLEHCLINAVVNLELFVERLQHRSQDGHMIFQWLAPNIELLAITLPIFDNKTIFRDEVLQPTATAAADDYHLNNERNLMTHEATLGIFSSNNYEEDAQLNFDMMRLIEMKNNKTYDLNHVNRKNLIRRALTCGPSVQNLRRFRTLSEL
uniref:Potassium channel domain-containing protein n=1 Tax=Setaria digitata TaxID=48799 RepID=A0A915PKW7_9BILA